MNKERILLHSCCGPCSTAVIERLVKDYNITVIFYNPNITDEEEYKKRKNTQIFVIDKLCERGFKVDIIDDEYIPNDYYEKISGYENEKEGGYRCNLCFELRLDKVGKVARELNYDGFATTLTVSPHKSFEKISSIGREIAEKYSIKFLDENFKKKDGYKRSIDLSKELELYRQNYCGCKFSKWWEKN